MKRILLPLIILYTILSPTTSAYTYNEPHTFQSQLESARMKTVFVSIWLNESYPWMQSHAFLGLGTGTVIGDGLILTNAHVIKDGQNEISIKTYTGESYTGTLLSIDKEKDLALVSFESQAEGFTLSNVELYKGKPIMIVGQPAGLPQWSFSEGTIGTPAFDYKDTKGGSYTGIQTDAQVIGGNSGGPLIDDRGELVGIVRAANNNFSFAIPMSDIEIFLNRAFTP